jgi:threonine dehydrogenase-like Zn-dependent dehydrogenase
MTVDALWITEKRRVETRGAELRKPASGEVQVEIKASGICAGDIYLFGGEGPPRNYPFRFGHEGAGVILEKGADVKGIEVGDKVFCAGGLAMAQIITLPASQTALLPAGVEDFSRWIGEPVACVVNGLAQIEIEPADGVVLIGTGYMGLLTLQGLGRTLAGEIIAFDVDEGRVGLARQFGIGDVYLVDSAAGKEEIASLKAGGGVRLVIEASGSEAGLALANELIGTAGTLSLFAWHKGRRSFDGHLWHGKGTRIVNTSPMSERHFSERIRQAGVLMAKGVFDQSRLVTHVGHYEGAQRIMEAAYSKSDSYVKGVITFAE